MNTTGFSRLGLGAQTVKVLEGLDITEPTEIQTKAIPHVLAGRDIIASAETGSGKTAAFLLPIIEKLRADRGASALVLAPTRELASQIEENARSFSRSTRLRAVVVVGGASISKQIRALDAGADIIIATPGRLNDLI
ncbi:MAG TPA: DEAD/DEAH box helicase, partial [Blastocatellia bacterium]|nr:DEAD/DEAH box helicase [Blastocatellia bacterium]